MDVICECSGCSGSEVRKLQTAKRHQNRDTEESSFKRCRYRYGSNSVMSLVDNPEDPRMQQLHSRTKLTYIAFCGLILKLLTFHPSLTHAAIDSFLQILLAALGDIENSIPKRFCDIKKAVEAFLPTSESIPVCKNGCMLYHGEYQQANKCFTCNEPKQNTKTYHYIPLIPRLRALYEIPHFSRLIQSHQHKTSTCMTDIHHSPVWDKIYGEEGKFKERRCVALVYSADGFSPFHHSTTKSYSITNQTLAIFNLPPQIRTKLGMMLLTGLTPGPSVPSNLDVYHAPLVNELLCLADGVKVFDGLKEEVFTLKAEIILHVHDFPGQAKVFHGMNAGGKMACNKCLVKGKYLSTLKKVVYLGSRTFLKSMDPLRFEVNGFPELKVETEEATHRNFPKERAMAAFAGIMKTAAHQARPRSADRRKAKHVVQSVMASSGRTQCSQFDRLGSKEAEKSVVEVMHSVQVVAKHVIGVLSGHEDSFKVRDQERQLGRFGVEPARGEKTLPPAPFTLTTIEKTGADNRMSGVRVPSDMGVLPSTLFTSFHGMKSHTWYLLMTQGILVYMLKGTLGDAQRQAITHLCNTLMMCCAKELEVNHLQKLEERTHRSLCFMERDFPVTIQTILMHTLHHLPACLMEFGPVRGYWMFPFERQIHGNIIHIHNRRSPEGAAIEAHKIEVVCELLEGAGLLNTNIIQTARPNSAEQVAGELGKVEKKMLLNAYFQIYPQLAGIERNLYREYTASRSSRTFSTWQPIRQVSPVEIQLIQGPSSEIVKSHQSIINGYTYIGQESSNNPSVVSHRSFSDILYFGIVQYIIEHNFLAKPHIFASVKWLKQPTLDRETEQFICDLDGVEGSLNYFVHSKNLSVPLITAVSERSLHILNFIDAFRFSELLSE